MAWTTFAARRSSSAAGMCLPVKHFSKQKGEPWDFGKESKQQKQEKKKEEQGREKKGPWKDIQLERPEWGHVVPDGTGVIECPMLLKEEQVEAGVCGLGPMSWETFADKARMILEPQGGPLAVILPGTLEEAKKKRQYLFRGDFEDMFTPTEIYCPATDPLRGRRILEPALLVQLGRVEIHLLHQKPEISLRVDKRLEALAREGILIFSYLGANISDISVYWCQNG